LNVHHIFADVEMWL